MKKMKNKGLYYSISGLLIVGLGLSLLGEAIIKKYTNTSDWILWGTIALVITNSGLCLLGQAIIEKLRHPKNIS
jgi:hypothetical protein